MKKLMALALAAFAPSAWSYSITNYVVVVSNIYNRISEDHWITNNVNTHYNYFFTNNVYTVEHETLVVSKTNLVVNVRTNTTVNFDVSQEAIAAARAQAEAAAGSSASSSYSADQAAAQRQAAAAECAEAIRTIDTKLEWFDEHYGEMITNINFYYAEDLQARARIDTNELEISGLESDVGEIRDDIGEIREDITNLYLSVSNVYDAVTNMDFKSDRIIHEGTSTRMIGARFTVYYLDEIVAYVTVTGWGGLRPSSNYGTYDISREYVKSGYYVTELGRVFEPSREPYEKSSLRFGLNRSNTTVFCAVRNLSVDPLEINLRFSQPEGNWRVEYLPDWETGYYYILSDFGVYDKNTNRLDGIVRESDFAEGMTNVAERIGMLEESFTNFEYETSNSISAVTNDIELIRVAVDDLTNAVSNVYCAVSNTNARVFDLETNVTNMAVVVSNVCVAVTNANLAISNVALAVSNIDERVSRLERGGDPHYYVGISGRTYDNILVYPYGSENGRIAATTFETGIVVGQYPSTEYSVYPLLGGSNTNNWSFRPAYVDSNENGMRINFLPTQAKTIASAYSVDSGCQYVPRLLFWQDGIFYLIVESYFGHEWRGTVTMRYFKSSADYRVNFPFGIGDDTPDSGSGASYGVMSLVSKEGTIMGSYGTGYIGFKTGYGKHLPEKTSVLRIGDNPSPEQRAILDWLATWHR